MKAKNQDVEVLRILYLRIMSMHFNHGYISLLIGNGFIEKEFPDMQDGLLWMFANDVFITIGGMLSGGKYSFRALCQANKNIKDLIDESEKKINSVIPHVSNYRYIRDKMFAHFMEKRDQQIVMNMWSYFDRIFNILTELHRSCMCTLNVNEKELNGYTSATFTEMDKRSSVISDMLSQGVFSFEQSRIFSKYGLDANDDLLFPRYPVRENCRHKKKHNCRHKKKHNKIEKGEQ